MYKNQVERLMKLEKEVKSLRTQVRNLASRGGRPILADLKTASALFGVSASMLRYMCQTGQLQQTAFKLRGKWVIDVDGFAQLVKEGKIKNDDITGAIGHRNGGQGVGGNGERISEVGRAHRQRKGAPGGRL